MRLIRIFFFGCLAILFFPSSSVAQSAKLAQSALVYLGFDPGPVDGAWGSRSQAALDQFYEKYFPTVPNNGKYDKMDDSLLAITLADQVARIPDGADEVPFDLAVLFPVIKEVLISGDPPLSEEELRKTGAPKPGPVLPHVHDFNGDGCDDLMSQYMDSYANPRIVYGRRDIAAFSGEPEFETNYPKSRSIRNIGIRDLDGDGKDDAVAFTAPHGWDWRRGRYTTDYEPDFAILANGKTIVLGKETYSHGGLIGDVNGDGFVDIFPISEKTTDARFAFLGDGNGNFSESMRIKALSTDVIFDAESADLNGDGIDDFAIAIARRYDQGTPVSHMDAGTHGTLAIAFGEKGRSINELEFKKMGDHWMGDPEWISFRILKPSMDPGYSGAHAYSAPSNIDLLDVDSDGDLDILVGYFASENSTWLTSGFRVFRNQDGQFEDATDELVPFQPGNRDLSAPTSHMLAARMVDLNRDGKPDLLLSMQSRDQPNRSGYSSILYINAGTRLVPVKSEQIKPLADLRRVKSGDFNCDGNIDLVGQNRRGTYTFLLSGN